MSATTSTRRASTRERMIEYIEQDRAEGKPFFAYLAYTAPHWPLQAPDEVDRALQGPLRRGLRGALREPLRAPEAARPRGADARADRRRAFPPALERAFRRGAALRGSAHGNLCGDGQRSRSLRRARSSRTSSASASSTTPSSCSCPTTARSPRGATSCAPISEHVGKEYDHSLDNLGRANSYVMYGANWASVSAVAVSPPQSHGVRGRRARAGVRALSAHGRAPARAATASAPSWISCRRSWRWPARSIRERRIAAGRCAAHRVVVAADADAARADVHPRRTTVFGCELPATQRAPRRLEDRLGSARAPRAAALATVQSRGRSVRAARLEREQPRAARERWSGLGAVRRGERSRLLMRARAARRGVRRLSRSGAASGTVADQPRARGGSRVRPSAVRLGSPHPDMLFVPAGRSRWAATPRSRRRAPLRRSP